MSSGAGNHHRVHWPLAICSMAALVWLLVARVAGPLDVWDQTQPKTICYTTDIVLNGNWMLPIEAGERPATKPPLFNWIAAPFVKVIGFGSVIAHKMPSVISIALCWLIVVRLGNGIEERSRRAGSDVEGDQHAPMVGWLAGLLLVATYPMFKLGYLARPDMVLTLCITLAWVAATALFVRIGDDRDKPVSVWLPIALWVSVGLAGLAKGPAALVPVIYVFFAARVIGGSWGAVNRSEWWWGLPVAIAMVGGWVYAAWLSDPEHVYQVLWHDEIYGRVTGTGPEGSNKGPIGFVIDLPNMGLYYIARFAPWSVLTVLAGIDMFKPRPRKMDAAADVGGARERNWRAIPQPARSWVLGSVLMIVVTVGFFTLSTGKRADYLAPCYPAAAILAAWWLVKMPPRLGVRAKWLVPSACAVILAILTIADQRQPAAPDSSFPRKLERFVHEARSAIEQNPAPVAFWDGGTVFQALLGASVQDGAAYPSELVERSQPFWLITSRTDEMAWRIAGLQMASNGQLKATTVVESDELDGPPGWPKRHVLIRFE